MHGILRIMGPGLGFRDVQAFIRLRKGVGDLGVKHVVLSSISAKSLPQAFWAGRCSRSSQKSAASARAGFQGEGGTGRERGGERERESGRRRREREREREKERERESESERERDRNPPASKQTGTERINRNPRLQCVFREPNEQDLSSALLDTEFPVVSLDSFGVRLPRIWHPPVGFVPSFPNPAALHRFCTGLYLSGSCRVSTVRAFRLVM